MLPKVPAGRVANRWMHGILATEIRAARSAPKYTKLYVFDIDGTLLRSPGPPEDYDNPEGPEAWWSDPASLEPPALDLTPGPEMWHQDTVKRMREAIADPDSYVVAMTGRNRVLQARLQKILESNGLHPDELITNPQIGDTSGYKRQEMKYLLHQLPNVREVEFWEDKKADLKGYKRLGEKLGVRFTPHLVRNYEDEPPPYLGIFLDSESKNELLRRFPPKHGNIEADHVTVMFRPSEEEMDAFLEDFQFGQQIPMKVTGYAEDDKGQALAVELPTELSPHVRRSPHITVSLAPGVEPLYSNELIEEGTTEVEPVTVKGVLDGGPRKGSPDLPEGPQQPAKQEKVQLWREFLQGETPNPEFGKSGHKERIKRKTLYDAGGAGRRAIMREWGPYLQKRRKRS